MVETSAVDRESILALDPKMRVRLLSMPLYLYVALCADASQKMEVCSGSAPVSDVSTGFFPTAVGSTIIGLEVAVSCRGP